MLLNHHFLTVALFTIFIPTVLSLIHKDPRRREGVLKVEKELEATVIKPGSKGRFNTRDIFNAIARKPVKKSPGHERPEKETESGINVTTSAPPVSEASVYSGSTNETDDILIQTSTGEHVDSIPKPENTSSEVDPNDPEEIERIEFYSKHKETFKTILDINENVHPGGMIQGDIKPLRLRNAGGSKWPKTTSGIHRGLVRIPYKISSKYNATHRRTIRNAMAAYAKYTCIRFVPRQTEISYLFINDAKGCWAYVGKTGFSAQTVSLGIPGCVSKGIAMHELMHAVGFQHEHSRSDRDQYVQILHDNIAGDGTNSNFDKLGHTNNLVVYDYNSIMHYSKNSFAKKPYLPSILVSPRRKPEPYIGQRRRLSPYDIEELRYLYECGAGSFKRCGRDFVRQRRGSFESPSFPKAYPKEAHCTWSITVKTGKYVKVTFKDVDLTDSNVCQNDVIYIHDGKNAAAPVLRTICGKHRRNIEVTSTGNRLFVIFSSDSVKDTNTGFRAGFIETSAKGSPAPRLVTPKLPPITRTVKTLYCDFDTDMCNLEQDKLDSTDWIRIKGPTPSRDTGPFSDHTTGRGHYIFVESSLPAVAGDNAIIKTPWFARKYRFCVSFSYHMRGFYMGGLRLYAYEKRRGSRYGHEILLWEKFGNQGRDWKTHELSYAPKSNVEHVQFYWETYIFYYQSDCAMDDLFITPGKCTANRRPATTPRPRRPKTTTARPKTRPPVRRTTTPKITTTQTTSTAPPVVAPIPRLNCTFETDLCGFQQSNDDNFDWTRHAGETPSASTGPPGDHTTGTGHYMFIEASSPRREGHIARLVSPPLTPTKHCLRMWYNMYGKQTGKLTVTQVVNGVSVQLAEKLGDSGKRWLPLTVEINSGDVRKSVRTRQDAVPEPTPLRPRIEEEEGSEEEEESEEEEGEQPIADDFLIMGNPVQNAVGTSINAQIIIEATTGKGYAGDIAIDDVVITDSACEQTVAPSVNTTLSDQFSCDFETPRDLCGFTQSQSDDFDWLPNSGSTGSSGTGPSADNTKKTEDGIYMFVESSSPRRVNDVAELVTPKLTPGRYCVRFAYHMYGAATGELKVFSLEEPNDSSPAVPVRRWREVGDQGDEWRNQSFEFGTDRTSRSVVFIFQSMIGSSFTSDIAIDDIEITKGGCSSVAKPPKTTPRTTTQRSTTTKKITTRKPRTTQPPTTTTRRPRTTRPQTTTRKPRTTKPQTTTRRPKTTKPKTTTRRPKTTRRPRTTRPQTTTRKPTTTKPQTTTRRPRTTKPNTTTRRPKTTRRPRTRRPKTRKPRTTLPPTTRKTTTTRATTAQKATTPISSTSAPPTKPIRPTTIPLPTSDYPEAFACDFEDVTLCGITQEQSDDFDWVRIQDNTPSGGTGPTSDHTTGLNGKGHYLFLESSSPRKRGDVAELTTPKLALESPQRCVTFWYHMWGSGIGALRVFADMNPSDRVRKTDGNVLPKSPMVFQERSNQGQGWKMARFEVNQDADFYGGYVQFKIAGERGQTFQGDIAIDDICIADGPCDSGSQCSPSGVLRGTTLVPPIAPRIRRPPPPPPVTTTTQKPTTRPRRTTKRPATVKVTTTRQTTTVRPARPRSSGPTLWSGMPLCTFERNRRNRNPSPRSANIPGDSSQDLGNYTYPNPIANGRMCGWRQLSRSQDQFDWTRHSGSTKSSGTGPSGDHTTKTGNYMYIEASTPQKLNDIALLQTYPMPPTDYCVDFYYHMYGAFVGRLSVRAVQKLTNGRHLLSTLSVKAGNQRNVWKNQRVNYRPRANAMHVSFRLEGAVGKDYRGDIAVDDITILPGRCDACNNPTKSYTNELNQKQTFTTGCVNTELFWVRCCSLNKEKAVYRRVSRCNANMFSSVRLNWYCKHL